MKISKTWHNILDTSLISVLFSLTAESFVSIVKNQRARIKKMQKNNIEGCEVRTRADKRPVDLKSTALDHSANPPFYKILNFAHFYKKKTLVGAHENIDQVYIIWVFICKEQEQRWNFEDSLFQRSGLQVVHYIKS